MLEGLRGYVQLASGLTEATAAKAREVAQALVAQGGVSGIPANAGAMAVQMAGLAEDLIETARSNRGVLVDLVRTEVERGVAAVGVVTAADVEGLRRRVADLEAALADAGVPAYAQPARATAAAKKSSAKKSAAKKTPAKKSAAKKTPAKKSAAKKSTAQEAATRQAPTQGGTGE